MGVVALRLRPVGPAGYRDPGFDVDLLVAGRLRALIAVWLGDTTVPAAVRDGTLRLEGPRGLVRAFPGWLRRSAFAEVARPQGIRASV